MTEPSTSTALACRDCDAPLVAKTAGARPEYCPPCRKERARIANRDAARRRRAGIRIEAVARDCVDCRAEFTPRRVGRRVSQRCDPCRDEFAREGVRRWQREKGHRKTGDLVELTCQPCGAAFGWAVDVGRPPWICEQCKLDSYIARAPQRRRHNHQRRARVYGVGYELFDPREIYERDRWICGICRKRISRMLTFPHPRSVSLDHVVPLSQGGQHSRANSRSAHLECNVARNNRGGNEQLALLG